MGALLCDARLHWVFNAKMIMELTKQDKKHIEERVKKLQWRVVDEAAEYARLYEKTFYEEVIKMCQERIEVIDMYHEQVTKVANDET